MTGDRERGIEAVKKFYSASLLFTKGVTFPQLIELYDKQSPNFLYYFGGAVRVNTESNVNNSMKTLGMQAGGRIPDRQSFFDALADEAVSFKFSDVSSSIVEGLKDTGKVVAVAGTAALSIYVIVGIVALFFAFQPRRA